MVWNLFLEPLPGSLLDEVEREEAVFQALDTDVLGARLSAPIGYNLACSIEVASLAVMCPLGPASASNLVKSNVIEWKSADEICTLGADKGYDATAFVAIRALKVTPHIAQNLSGRRSAAASKPEQCRPPLHGGPMRTRSLSLSTLSTRRSPHLPNS